MVLFLLSFLGILSDWSNILQEEGDFTKDKNLCHEMQQNSIKNSRKHFYGKIMNFGLNSMYQYFQF